jgi:hypothetical protein
MNLYPYNSYKINSRFRIDCNNRLKKKNSNFPVCPAENNQEDILNCCQNNYSKACPVLLCNYQKQAEQNSKILNRFFPDQPQKVTKPIRGGYYVCKKYYDLDSKEDESKIDLHNEINDFQSIQGTYIPGKGSGTDFLRKIDIDSNIKNLNYRMTDCPAQKYTPKSQCLNKKVSGPKLLTNPYCQNYKRYSFNDKTSSYKTFCQNNPQIVDKYNIGTPIYANSKAPNLCQETLKMNFKNCNYSKSKKQKNCINHRPFGTCQETTEWKSQPILYGFNSDIPCGKSLFVGPERTNHQCENLWNNVTKRKYIS